MINQDLEIIQIGIDREGVININGTIVSEDEVFELMNDLLSMASQLTDNLENHLQNFKREPHTISKLEKIAMFYSKAANEIVPKSLSLLNGVLSIFKDMLVTNKVILDYINKLNTLVRLTKHLSILSVFSDEKIASSIIFAAYNHEDEQTLSDCIYASFVHTVLIDKLIEESILIQASILENTEWRDTVKKFWLHEYNTIIAIVSHQSVLKASIEERLKN
jgi:hypothetical protein